MRKYPEVQPTGKTVILYFIMSLILLILMPFIILLAIFSDSSFNEVTDYAWLSLHNKFFSHA